jgi:DNA-binding IclR family transcriptional regulator
MREALEQVRERGWCTGAGLVMPGLSGIAAPVPNPDGLPVAALSVSAADSRLTPERALELAPSLLEAARRVGAVLAAG